ncbi:6-bladed beta-propeller [Candidatus Sulfurimonas baltica]|uniref:6-bladed beta-propeller n=1 Tax=Candidatus Sulfurimonas baltica TaxID=2740404 RepID=A0A7S7LUT2_9BACT|nr:6-bladed beta-propeller [Candidatus Sulfurimonas baltica]QOY51872.1 6-bladed beta-propeller [Candidatus Sulfurimonas baltica]
MRIFFIFSFIVVSILFQGCFSKEVKVEKVNIVYPSFPDEPRIQYLETYRGENNEKVELNTLDIILGESIENKSKNPLIVKPYGVTIDNGKLYAVDTATKMIFVIDEKTKDVSFIGDGLSGPVGIAFDSKGFAYISDTRRKAVMVYNEKGKLLTAIGSRLEFAQPTGIAIDKKLNRLYVADTKGHKIKVFDIETKKMLLEIGKRGHADGEFNFPTNVAIDSRNNNLIVSDTQNFRVQIFDKDGKFIRTFGKVGTRPGEFTRPKGIGVDSEGHIYVTDSAFNNVQVFDDKGTLLLYFGGAGYVKPGTFRLISGLYIDENDKIIIADGFTGRIQTFQYLSEKWKLSNPEKYKELSGLNGKINKEEMRIKKELEKELYNEAENK